MAKFSLFGWSFVRDKEDEVESFAPQTHDDGAQEINQQQGYSDILGVSSGAVSDSTIPTKTEAELITEYRKLALESEIQSAVEEITNEAIVIEDNKPVASVSTDRLENLGISKKIQERIRDEFDEIIRLIDFNNTAYELFKRWYVDGRFIFHVVINEKAPDEGIKELRYVDPRKIKKVRLLNTEMKDGVALEKTVQEYYMYAPEGYSSKDAIVGGVKNKIEIAIASDSIIYGTSGIMDESNKIVLSYLHQAIVPLNQLRNIEEAILIYRVSRAPERRVFYIEIGNLPKTKAEQYLRDMMVKHKNRLVYDASTGKIVDARKHMTMLEDFWLPRREGRGTEVTTLQGGGNLGEIGDAELFKEKLNKSLHLPQSRFEENSSVMFGRESEIARDELKFQKFIDRVRRRFSTILLEALGKQLVLKNVIAEAEWSDIRSMLTIEFASDSFLSEIKNNEVWTGRVQLANDLTTYVGDYFSKEFIYKDIFRQTDEQIEEHKKKIEEEKKEGEIPEENPDFFNKGDDAHFGNGSRNDPPEESNPINKTEDKEKDTKTVEKTEKVVKKEEQQ